MPTTTNLLLPYPASSDPPDGPNQIGGIASTYDAFFGAWTVYTPGVTQTGAVTLTSSDSAYIKQGKLVKVRFSLVVSGTGTASSVILIDTPVNAAANGMTIVGGAYLNDVSTLTELYGSLVIQTGVNNKFAIQLAGGSAGLATFTAALAAGDRMFCYGKYQAA